MFHGTIPDKMRMILAKYIPNLGDKITVLCSGNFTAESTFRRNGYAGKIISADVSLYSCAIGWFLTGIDFRLEIKNPKYDWVSNFIEDPVSKAATVMLMLDLSDVSAQKNQFQKRIFESYILHWDEMHKKTKEKLIKFRDEVKIDRFDAVDIHKNMQTAEGCIVAFMPTYKSGYERLYKTIQGIFDWDQPNYKIFEQTSEFYTAFLESMKDRKWLIVSEHDLSEFLAGYETPKSICEKNRTITCRLYSNFANGNYYAKRNISAAYFPYQPIGDLVINAESRIEIVEIEQGKINYLREVYMGQNVKLSAKALFSNVVYIDDRVAGGFSWSFQKYPNKNKKCIYLLADFCLPSINKRLSKLIIMLALTQEMKGILEKKFIERFDCLTTTAFTINPISMKYRGIMELEKRGDGFLNYGAPMGQYSIQEALAQWLKKYASNQVDLKK